MATSRPILNLKRIENIADHEFEVPSKKINDGNDLNFFLASTAYRDITQWLFQLNRSLFPIKLADGTIEPCLLDARPEITGKKSLSDNITTIRGMLDDLSELIADAPPDTGPRRFGNLAFRKWYELAAARTPALLDNVLLHLVDDLMQPIISGKVKNDNQAAALRDEINAYLLASFGSAQRLDNGTGHELSFLAFVGCLWKLGAFQDGDERRVVVEIIQPYLELVRKLITTYTLEPAGSHGVWGLDDHSFLPYVFGSAQLGPPILKGEDSGLVPTEGSFRGAPSPSSVADKTMVSDLRASNMYFSAIQFIYDVKKGPFWEHSPTLYDISGIKDGWGKINKGMLKMYAAEVLGKFPVVQHFPFGSMFRWERDPAAANVASTFHAQQQPPLSKDVPPVSANTAGTVAPWARPGGTSGLQIQSSTGLPSTRATAASTGRAGRPAPTSSVEILGAGTAAPWARKDATR